MKLLFGASVEGADMPTRRADAREAVVSAVVRVEMRILKVVGVRDVNRGFWYRGRRQLLVSNA